MTDTLDVLTLRERVRATLVMSESHFREFKSAFEGSPGKKIARDPRQVKRDIGETLVAFANADGGELIVGVEDDGSITGVPHSEDVVESFLGAWKTHVHGKTPLERPVALTIHLDGQKLLYFSVEKGTSVVHLTQDGRCLQRKDRESVPVASEMIRFERMERLSREYDRGFMDGADASALHEETVHAVGALVAPGMSTEKLLQLLGLAEYSASSLRLRRAALLLFAKDVSLWHPRCEVRILRVSGTELRTGRDYNVVSDKHIVDNIAGLLQTAWDELRPYLVETRLGPDGRFQEQVRYPEDACREALTNAIAHRDYTIEGRAIEVYVFDDRLEVRSPGALLTTITVEGLRTLSGVHQSRNTAVARTLRELGYMREMGEGFRRMFQLMRAHDLVEPEVSVDAQQFSVSLRHRSVFSEEDQRWIAAFEDFQLERDEEKVLLLGKQGDSLSVQQIMDAVDIVDTEDYRLLIERLLTKGLLRGLKATNSTGKARRNSPRWAVVSPEAASRFLGEIVLLLSEIPDGTRLDAAVLNRIADSLSTDNPYKRGDGNLKKPMLALGLIDSRSVLQRKPSVVGRRVYSGLDAATTARSLSPASPGKSQDSKNPALSTASTTELEEAESIAESRGTAIYVGNLPWNASSTEVRQLAEQFGSVSDVRVPRDVTGRHQNRGYAFVEYADESTAKAGRISLDGAELNGRSLTADWASSGRSR